MFVTALIYICICAFEWDGFQFNALAHQIVSSTCKNLIVFVNIFVCYLKFLSPFVGGTTSVSHISECNCVDSCYTTLPNT